MESRNKGTMILHYKGQFLKVIKVRSQFDNTYSFECKDLGTKKDQTLTLNLSGFLEALDKALPAMKNLDINNFVIGLRRPQRFISTWLFSYSMVLCPELR